MPVLTDEERNECHRGLMRWMSSQWEVWGLSKADLRAAVDATDTWIDANAAAYNLALPVAARTALNGAQKTLLFCVVALRRVNKAALRALLGEVD